METVDCRGLNCPEPVLRAKAFLEKAAGEPFVVLVDNEASRENVLRFGRSQGCDVSSVDDESGAFRLVIAPTDVVPQKEEFQADDYSCDLSQQDNVVYVLPSDTMGRGSDELGWALLQTFVVTISEVSPLPSHILLYNGGVKLATTEGKALEALQNLEQKGVVIWCCGTCLEFFKMEDKRKVGTITNMYDILATMSSATRLVSPL